MGDLRPLLLAMHKILTCSSDAEILVDPFLVPHRQHYLSTPCSIFLPAPGSAPLCHARTLQNTPRFLICSVYLHPYTTHSSTLASDTIQLLLEQQLPADLDTNSFDNAHSSTQPLRLFSPVSCITCVQSHLCHTAPVSSEQPVEHWQCISTAEGTPHGVCLGLACRGPPGALLKCGAVLH